MGEVKLPKDERAPMGLPLRDDFVVKRKALEGGLCTWECTFVERKQKERQKYCYYK